MPRYRTITSNEEPEFKEVNQEDQIWPIRVGIGWRALGIVKNKNVIVWFWIGSHPEYDKLLKKL